jgi:hypothetical protein
MKKRFRTICIICAAAAYLGAVLGYAFLRPAYAPSREEATVHLSIPAEALEMGTVWEDDRFAWTVPIENRETLPIEVASFSTSCNCASIAPESFVLEPGERCELHLDIDLTKQTKPNGEVSISLFPRLKTTPGSELEKRRPPQWTVKGHVRRILKLQRKVELGRCSEFSQPMPVRSIPIEILTPLESLSAQCNSTNFSTWIELPPSGEGKATLFIKQSKSLPVGEFHGTVTLKATRKGGKLLPARKLEFTGRIVPDIQAVPPVVQVGGRRLGEIFEDVVVLRSMSGKALGAMRAEAEGEGLSVEADKESGGYCIRQKVCREGSQTNRVRFVTESGKHPVTIAVPVSYTGIEVP